MNNGPVYGAGVTPVPINKIVIPNNANNILNKIKAQNENRVVSEQTIDSSELNTSERKRGRKPKSVIHIET